MISVLPHDVVLLLSFFYVHILPRIYCVSVLCQEALSPGRPPPLAPPRTRVKTCKTARNASKKRIKHFYYTPQAIGLYTVALTFSGTTVALTAASIGSEKPTVVS